MFSNTQDIISMILKYSGCKVPVYLYIHIDHTNFESANFATLQQNKHDEKKEMRKKRQKKYQKNYSDG